MILSLKTNTDKTHSYNGFALNVTKCFLDTYDPIYRIDNCDACRFQYERATLFAGTIFIYSIIIYITYIYQENKNKKFLTRYPFCIALYCV